MLDQIEDQTVATLRQMGLTLAGPDQVVTAEPLDDSAETPETQWWAQHVTPAHEEAPPSSDVAIRDAPAERPGADAKGDDLAVMAGGDVAPGGEAAPVDGAETLCSVRAFLRHFAEWPSEAALTLVTLWIAASYARNAKTGEPVFEYCSRLLFTAEDFGGGKSWFAKLTGLLCANAMSLLDPTKPALVDFIGDGKLPIITEVDELFGTPGKNRALLTAINASYESGHYGIRMQSSKRQEVHLFTWLILDGLESIVSKGSRRPDLMAMATRSHIVKIKMAPSGYRHPRITEAHLEVARRGRERLASWTAACVAAGMGAGRFPLPEGLGNRRADLWEPLFELAWYADLPHTPEGKDVSEGEWSTAVLAAYEQFETPVAPAGPEPAEGEPTEGEPAKRNSEDSLSALERELLTADREAIGAGVPAAQPQPEEEDTGPTLFDM